jgi:hypothetical protein
MNYNNYSISASKGKLYLKSKTPQDGFEKVTYGTNGENVTYHQYHNSIKGIPTNLENKEFQHEGRTLKFLEFTLTDGDNSNKVSVPLKNKGGYTDEVKGLISALNGLEMGQEVTLNPSMNTYTNKKGEEKKQLQIYINYVNKLGENGKGLSTGYITFDEIPKPTSSVVAGDTVWDFSPQTEFYYEKLNTIQARFQNAPANTTPPTPVADKPKNSVPPATPEMAFAPADNTDTNPNMDSLPF